MSVRRERFCDLMIEEKEDSSGKKPKSTQKCTSPAVDRCFFCKRDYCQAHACSSYDAVKLELSGFKQNFKKVLPCCADCQVHSLPYNPEQITLKRLDRVWSAVKMDIRARKKKRRSPTEAPVTR